jgi:pimeloyl-ACP methyl ester carboxylesterase
MTPVAILIPGIMGSELRLDQDLIWPGPIASLKLPYDRMTALMRPDLQATDAIRKVGIFSQYSSLIEDLKTCGFAESGVRPTLYVFAYDWRKSNAESAIHLAKLIGDVDRIHQGAASVTLIAHSMGGLVCRYYLESSAFCQEPGFGSVESLITIGTPHRGAALALTAAVGLEKRLFLSKSQVLQLASDPRYPSTYELLPRGPSHSLGVRNRKDFFQPMCSIQQ